MSLNATSPIAISDIEAAARRLDGQIVRTPLLESAALNALAGCRLLVKAESLQRTGAFKIRGALNKMMSLPPEVRAKGVVASSSGNHGNALAAAAKMFGVAAKIVMPADAPAMKIDNTRRNGAEIILYDRTREDRFAIVEKLSRDTGMTNVPPYDDVDVMSGQGTIGIEIIDQCRAVGATPDAVLVPSSGGGLSSGITVAVKSLSPATRCYTVEPDGFDRMARSLRSGERETNPRNAGSIQDALIGAPIPGKLTFAALAANGASGLSVTDAEAMAAMAALFQHLKLVAEPGGAAAVAAILSGKADLAGKTVVAVCSGGNVDAQLFAEAITRG
ncbi:threonine dehydratase [Rhizobiales bacterium GAS191]|nr:threonine dehydratase [Rhizobiales bacterium GAS191]